MMWDLITLVGGLIIGLALRPYLTSYYGEKGKNLATKEDVGEITQKVEDVKAQFSRDLEFVKLQLTKKANVHRLVAKKEVHAIAEVGSLLVDLRLATVNLRPAFDRLPSDSERQKEVFTKRYAAWAEKHDEFYLAVEKHRLFLPKHIYGGLMAVKALSVAEGVSFETDFRFSHRDGGFTFEQYEKSQKKTTDLLAAIDSLCDVIQNRYEIEGLANVALSEKTV